MIGKSFLCMIFVLSSFTILLRAFKVSKVAVYPSALLGTGKHFKNGPILSTHLYYRQIMHAQTLSLDSSLWSNSPDVSSWRVELQQSNRGVLHQVLNSLSAFAKALISWILELFEVEKSKISKNTTTKPRNVTSSVDFISLPSTPINQIPSLNAGRQYAQAKLQEIEKYLMKGRTVPTNTRQYALGKAFANKRCISDIPDLELYNKRVLLRCELDVKSMRNGMILTDNEADEAASLFQDILPTINLLRSKGAKVLLCTHWGHPSSTGYDEIFSLQPVAKLLSTVLGIDVPLVPDCVGETVAKYTDEMKPGDVGVLEIVRFYAEGEANDDDFAKRLSEHVDVYVSDALVSSRHTHASVTGVPKNVKFAVSGLHLHRELDTFNKIQSVHLQNPKKPIALIMGGSGNIEKLNNLLSLLNSASCPDKVVLAGAVPVPFLGSGLGGKISFQDEKVTIAKSIVKVAAQKGVELILPTDVQISEYSNDTMRHIMKHMGSKEQEDKIKQELTKLKHTDSEGRKPQPHAYHVKTVPSNAIPAGWMALDIGPKSITRIKDVLANCKTVLWNGPMGVYTLPGFDRGTHDLIKIMSNLTQAGDVTTIATGDETVKALALQDEWKEKVTYVTSGGGEVLWDFLLGKNLPGIDALNDA